MRPGRARGKGGRRLVAVGLWEEDSSQTSDEEVRGLLAQTASQVQRLD